MEDLRTETPTATIPRAAMSYTLSQFDGADVQRKKLLRREDGRLWKISEDVAQILIAIDGTSNLQTVVDRARRSIGDRMTADDVSAVITVLLVGIGIVGLDGLPGLNASSPTELERPRSLLMFRIPLLPPTCTAIVARLLSPLFRRDAAVVLFVIALCIQASGWVLHSWSVAAVLSLSARQSMIATMLLFGSFFLHEMGHISMARSFTGRAGEIGFGIYFIYPVLYADVTDTWKLSRVQRAFVDMAGIYAQLLLSSLLILISLVAPNPAVTAAVIGIGVSCLANLNPFLRLDGYWLLSDVTGIANLNAQSRDLLFGRVKDTSWLTPRTAAYLLIYTVIVAGFWAWLIVRLVRYYWWLARGNYAHIVGRLIHLAAVRPTVHGRVPLISYLASISILAIMTAVPLVYGVRVLRRLAALCKIGKRPAKTAKRLWTLESVRGTDQRWS